MRKSASSTAEPWCDGVPPARPPYAPRCKIPQLVAVIQEIIVNDALHVEDVVRGNVHRMLGKLDRLIVLSLKSTQIHHAARNGHELRNDERVYAIIGPVSPPVPGTGIFLKKSS